uniref:Uncharacterized protein n=1 Tax=Laticauda laticaudata TaxID=8630 RepID=A0A8C5SFX0_LATLA
MGVDFTATSSPEELSSSSDSSDCRSSTMERSGPARRKPSRWKKTKGEKEQGVWGWGETRAGPGQPEWGPSQGLGAGGPAVFESSRPLAWRPGAMLYLGPPLKSVYRSLWLGMAKIWQTCLFHLAWKSHPPC